MSESYFLSHVCSQGYKLKLGIRVILCVFVAAASDTVGKSYLAETGIDDQLDRSTFAYMLCFI